MWSVAVHACPRAGVAQGALDGIPPVDPAAAGAEVTCGEMIERLLDRIAADPDRPGCRMDRKTRIKGACVID
jgi:hypothetical protein